MSEDTHVELERALADGQEPRAELLESLSNLDGDQLASFQRLWARLGPDARAALLGRLGEAATENLILDFSTVFAQALDDRDTVVREMALRLAADETRPDLLEAYVAAASADPDARVRAAALEGLSSYTLAAQSEEWPSEVQQRLESTLVDALHQHGADLNSRRAALLSLAYLTTPQSEAEIRQAHLQPDLRDAAIEAMGRNCQDLWIPDLDAELKEGDPELRTLAAESAGQLENERLVPALVERLADSDEDVRMAAIEALGLIGGSDAKSELSALLQSRDEATRDAARDAIETLLDSDDPLRGLQQS